VADTKTLNEYVRSTKATIRREFIPLLDELNKGQGGSIQEDQIRATALPIIERFEPHVREVEEFVLTSINEEWGGGLRAALSFAGDWITLSAHPQSRSLRFAQGAPQLLAWRLLILAGSKIFANEITHFLKDLVHTPIEVEDIEGRFSHLSLGDRVDLFHPEAFLGRASTAAEYIRDLFSREQHLHPFFADEVEYHFSMAQFLIVISLYDAWTDRENPLYPMYSDIPEARRAMQRVCSLLESRGTLAADVAAAVGVTVDSLLQAWSAHVAKPNGVFTGMLRLSAVKFPDPISAPVGF